MTVLHADLTLRIGSLNEVVAQKVSESREMFRLLNGILQTANTNSSRRKQLFENVSSFVSVTAG